MNADLENLWMEDVTNFLRAFAKCEKRLVAIMREATSSFVVSVRPHGTTRLPQDGFFMKCDIVFFSPRKSVQKIQVSLKSYKNCVRFLLVGEEQNLQVQGEYGRRIARSHFGCCFPRKAA